MTASADRPRPVVLCILDGWGWREEAADNAVLQAMTPTFDRFWESCPRAFLNASERHVGLPAGQIGNSEVGHLNLGAGRVVLQELPRIDAAIDDGEFDRNDALQGLISNLSRTGGACHLIGLVSPGGVHSHQRHLVALAAAVAKAGVPVRIHAFLDGRDVPPTSAKGQVADFLDAISGLNDVRVTTVTGRYYAMDRDKRWERVERAYHAIVSAEAPTTTADILGAIQASYDAGVGDEFVEPIVVGDYGGMTPGDGLLCANFRSDRVREILAALIDPDFDGFAREAVPDLVGTVGMRAYSDALARQMDVIFPPSILDDVMGKVVADAGLTQLRIAETEKYPHVTFFFNGGEETQYPGEERILVPSPKVATYDLQPEMSAPEVTDKVVAAVDSGQFDVIVINYANPDMVGHTGDLAAAITAVETVDSGLARLADAVDRAGGAMIVTADHGNCELMRDPSNGGPHTAHTLNRVPLFVIGAPEGTQLSDGVLADIAPTMLELLGLPKPAAMTGSSLIGAASSRSAAE